MDRSLNYCFPVDIPGFPGMAEDRPDIKLALNKLIQLPAFRETGWPQPCESFSCWSTERWSQFVGGVFIDTRDGHSAKALFGAESLALIAQQKLTDLGVISEIFPGFPHGTSIVKLIFNGEDLLGKDIA